ncbi:hypothetical protein SAMN05660337_2595 [Maridesulfovibrio ferrireducens]|uniref:Uncharacterized protein n=1 Tax=Maridesulfovibrio ferrireducens TaxID=246191 RepID=A0A1G9J1C7_9BACT|nr:hypothetical protein [Maridesulfovibrio ferrireducens]SDL31013.1 hypothetical protein SAMN05660337_2595 [Maridesulfovibrio ferrireducens]
MTKDRDMQDIAAEYAGYFDFDFGDSGVILNLTEEAPPELLRMIKDLFGNDTQEALVKVYEALNTVSEADDVFNCEVDEKICTLTIFCKIVRHLEKIAKN